VHQLLHSEAATHSKIPRRTVPDCHIAALILRRSPSPTGGVYIGCNQSTLTRQTTGWLCPFIFSFVSLFARSRARGVPLGPINELGTCEVSDLRVLRKRCGVTRNVAYKVPTVGACRSKCRNSASRFLRIFTVSGSAASNVATRETRHCGRSGTEISGNQSAILWRSQSPICNSQQTVTRGSESQR
jgi:hypothetical protein